MRKNIFFAASIAALTFTGCANDEYVGEVENPKGELSEISFVGKNGALSRATASLNGNNAADKLNERFYVYGTKHTAEENGTKENDALVFNNYRVEYSNGSTSATNTSGWEYVGLSFDQNEINNVKTNTSGVVQTPKYWDYGAANGYTFYAFSAKPGDITSNKVNVEKTTEKLGGTGTVYDKGYNVILKSDADLESLYFADRKPVDKPTSDNKQYSTVKFTFRNIVSKVRVGFYETIPGYSVQINNMYGDDNGSFSATPTTDKFAAICPNIKANQNATVTVTYYNNTETVLDQNLENQPKVTTTLSDVNSLELGAGVLNTQLGELSTSPTWDTNSGKYTLFWPQPGNTTNMKIKVDYTLTSTDGSGETINVTGATAEIPYQYVAWKPGFAYTYLFKISDNTNGSTGNPGDPEGLFPITFDAVVVDSESDGLHEYITTVSEPSITTHSEGSAVTTDGEYKTDAVIYIVTMENGNAIEFDNNKMKLYRVTYTGNYEITENAVIEAISKPTDKLTCTEVTSSDADKLEESSTVPDTDGQTISVDAAKFKAGAAGTVYAFVYTKSASEKYAKVIRIKKNTP